MQVEVWWGHSHSLASVRFYFFSKMSETKMKLKYFRREEKFQEVTSESRVVSELVSYGVIGHMKGSLVETEMEFKERSVSSPVFISSFI